jgi:SAM-dependent methyltransferase
MLGAVNKQGRRTSGAPAPWDASYRDGGAQRAWDIGVAQPAFEALADAGRIETPVVDVGCGTGENSLMLAARGLEVHGVDWAPTAVAQASAKAADRNLAATFEVGDALDLSHLGTERFATAIDSGLFHVFEPDEAVRYAASVHGVVRAGGRFYVLCFSDREPDWGGPYRISQQQLQTAFADGWHLDSVEPSTFVSGTPRGEVAAWLATLRRI